MKKASITTSKTFNVMALIPTLAKRAEGIREIVNNITVKESIN